MYTKMQKKIFVVFWMTIIEFFLFLSLNVVLFCLFFCFFAVSSDCGSLTTTSGTTFLFIISPAYSLFSPEPPGSCLFGDKKWGGGILCVFGCGRIPEIRHNNFFCFFVPFLIFLKQNSISLKKIQIRRYSKHWREILWSCFLFVFLNPPINLLFLLSSLIRSFFFIISFRVYISTHTKTPIMYTYSRF